MSDPIRVAVVGGSGVATPELIDALKRRADRPALHITLIGRSLDKLEAVGAMCHRLAANTDPPITVSTCADTRRGIEGADYIVNQIRVGGYQQRAFDEIFPREFGIPGEETIGPGGMNMALRTIPVALKLCRDIQEIAPDALLINLTNPSSMVQYAMQSRSAVKVVSICDLPMMARHSLCEMLGIPEREAVVRYTGMNHFGWVNSIVWKNQEWLPAALNKLAGMPNPPIEPEIVQALGVIPTSYFRYVYHANRVLTAQQGKPARAEALMALEVEIMSAYQSGESDGKPAPLIKRNAAWYDHMIVPLLLDHANDTGQVQVLQVRNMSTHGIALPFMPPASIVEVPCVVRKNGILPLAYDDGLPLDCEAMLLNNAAFEMLWAESATDLDRSKALRAMLLNPLVSHYDQAKGLLDTMWPANGG